MDDPALRLFASFGVLAGSYLWYMTAIERPKTALASCTVLVAIIFLSRIWWPNVS